MVGYGASALRVPANQVDHNIERLPRISLGPLKALADVLDEILVTQWIKRNQPSLVGTAVVRDPEQRIEHAQL
jgi:hypothetical protein